VLPATFTQPKNWDVMPNGKQRASIKRMVDVFWNKNMDALDWIGKCKDGHGGIGWLWGPYVVYSFDKGTGGAGFGYWWDE